MLSFSVSEEKFLSGFQSFLSHQPELFCWDFYFGEKDTALAFIASLGFTHFSVRNACLGVEDNSSDFTPKM